MRNFYGYYLRQALGMDDLMIQRIMGYTDVSKVKKYNLDKSNVAEKLNSSRWLGHE